MEKVPMIEVCRLQRKQVSRYRSVRQYALLSNAIRYATMLTHLARRYGALSLWVQRKREPATKARRRYA